MRSNEDKKLARSRFVASRLSKNIASHSSAPRLLIFDARDFGKGSFDKRPSKIIFLNSAKILSKGFSFPGSKIKMNH